MKRKRGAAMLFVLVMVGLMTVAILATVELSTSAARTASRREAESKAAYAFEGAIQLFHSEFRQRTKSLPSNTVYNVGDLKVDLRALDNSSSRPRTILFTGSTTVQGVTYSFSEVSGNRLDPSPLDYALFTNSNLDPTFAITLGANGSLGDLGVNGSIVNRTNGFVINGDLEETGTTIPTGAVIAGNQLLGAPSLPFPTPNSLNYLTAALLSLSVNKLTNYVFPGTVPYPLLYRSGDLDLKGTITGRGTIFVTGTVYVPGDLTYADANARLVVIAGTGIRIQSAAKNVSGLFYTTGTFQNDSNVTISPGAVAAGTLVLGNSLTIVHDPALWNDRSEADKHRVPGFWP